jgi:glutamate formiminotransferase
VPLIECIPNVSEGRRAEVIDAIAAAIRGAGVALLDVSRDAAHHRSVFTFAGEPDAVHRAVLAMFDAAIPAIDLRAHAGVHPRMGAVDVVPLVPLAGASLDECAALARTIGAEVAAKFNLPVYLYEAAASAIHRRPLEQVRRGQFEGLAEKLQRAEWQPDFGPAVPHPTAGAAIVGARQPLIAFNVNLATDRLDVAKAVARAVRYSSGGLPCVKALGLPLADRGIVQVSMNLTDFRTTSMADAFRAVAAEAAHHGVAVLESELIGLVPAEALAAAGAAALALPRFTPEMLLEVQILAKSAGQRA